MGLIIWTSRQLKDRSTKQRLHRQPTRTSKTFWPTHRKSASTISSCCAKATRSGWKSSRSRSRSESKQCVHSTLVSNYGKDVAVSVNYRPILYHVESSECRCDLFVRMLCLASCT